MKKKNRPGAGSKEINVGVRERIFSLLSGSVLLYSALKNRKGLRGLTGGYLLFRGATGYCPAYKAIGMDTSGKARNINIKTVVTVNRPREEVYNFWRTLDNLPLFMKHLKRITPLDEKTSEWEVKIPGGLGTVRWTSEIVEDQPNERIGWRSLPDAPVRNAGNVHFRDAGKFGTEIHVVISYHAPAGKAGESLGWLLNPVFEKIVKEDIRNFRRYLETGELPTTRGQPSGK